MANAVDARRRWFGLFYLLIASGMLIWGQTILRDRLRGLGFLGYWLVCFGFTGLALLTALVDLRAVRRRTREEQKQLLERTLEDIERAEGDAKDTGKRTPRK